MIFIVISLLGVFFAVNMGGSSFAASFAGAYGGRILSERTARLLFAGFVILGAVILGQNVSQTLGQGIIPADLIDQRALLIIFAAAGISMFVGNLIHIPQSTSLVTVAAIAGVGAARQSVNTDMIWYCLLFWIGLPVISYLATLGVAGYVYPPRRLNFWIYERYVNQRDRLKMFVIAASCYNAFAVGTNNVANVVGPLSGFAAYPVLTLLLVFAVCYGMGGFIFTGSIKAVGENLVPLGLLTAAIISFVSGTLMIVASLFGVPQSFVMLQMGALFAVATLKHGPEVTLGNPVTQKTLYSWTINPVLTFVLTWGLSRIFMF